MVQRTSRKREGERTISMGPAAEAPGREAIMGAMFLRSSSTAAKEVKVALPMETEGTAMRTVVWWLPPASTTWMGGGWTASLARGGSEGETRQAKAPGSTRQRTRWPLMGAVASGGAVGAVIMGTSARGGVGGGFGGEG